jgi:hypothetical protein
MAACTGLVATPSTLNVTSYASGAFTPAANDLLVAIVATTASVDPTAAGTVTDSIGGTYFKTTVSFKSGASGTNYIFVRNQLATAVSHVATFTCTGDAATSAHILVYGVSGMTRTGSNAIRQTAIQTNQSAASTPAPAFGVAALTSNPCIGMVGALANPPGMTAPSGWTEPASPLFDIGAASPNAGVHGCHINSGFTGTTVTWGSTSSGAYGDIIVELDTSALVVGGRQGIRVLRQAVKRASTW